MPRFLRQFLSHFYIVRSKRRAFLERWGTTHNHGKNNRIIIVNQDGKEKILSGSAVVPGVDLCFKGDGNTLRLHEPFHFDRTEMTLSDGSLIEIQSTRHCVYKGLINPQKQGRVLIGKDFSANSGLEISGFDEPGLTVRIGDDCMFSWNVCLRPCDSHTVFDLESGKALNKGRDIVIGNHVWAALNTTFLKGARVPDNCVVGYGSVVTKTFDKPFSLIVGSPARRVDGAPVNWSRLTVYEYEQEQKAKSAS